MEIGFIGDTHSSSAVVKKTLDKLHGRGIQTIAHVGDFGFWPGNAGDAFLSDVSEHLEKNDQTLYITPGNHEDYNFLNHLKDRGDGWLKAAERVLVAPRGHRWEWDGVSFVSLGGAPSVDRTWRLEFQRKNQFPVWWPQEEITPEDVERTVAGGYADVMIAHDAPFGVPSVEKGIKGNPHNFTKEDLEYALEGRMKMKEAVDGVSPKLFFHGHYHWMVSNLINTTDGSEVRVLGLAADGSPCSWGVLDLITLEFEFGHKAVWQ